MASSAFPAPQRPLSGRTRELASVVEALGDPRIRLLVLSGPGGAGKSTLAAAALAMHAGDAVIGVGRFPPGNAFGAAPLAAALEAALAAALERLFDPEAAIDALCDALGDTAGAFAGLSDGLLAQLAGPGIGSPHNVGASAAAERLGQALVTVCGWLSSLRGAVLLVLDDWGRGGPEAAALVERLLREAPRLRIVATERSDEPLTRKPAVRALEVALGPLDQEARHRLVVGETGDAAAATDILDFLGPAPSLPFELLEALDVLKEGGGLVLAGAGWRLDRARSAEILGGTVAQRLASRVADTGPQPKALAGALALFGDSATPADLSAAAALDGAQTDRAIRQLEDLGAVRRSGAVVRFTHDHIQSAVLAGLSPPARRRAAARLAEALRRLGAAPAAYGRGAAMLDCRLAAGLTDAEAGAWAQLFLAGAERARGVGAAARASEWADAALALARRADSVSAKILREAAYAAVERGDYGHARAVAEEMLAISDSPRGRAEADEMRALVRRAQGDLEGALAVAHEAVGRVGVRLPTRAGKLELAVTALRVLTADVERAGRQGRLSAEALEVQAPLMRLLNATGSLLFEQEPMRAILFAIRGVPPRLVAGTAAGAATFSVLCAAFGAFRKAERWASLSDALQTPGQPLRATALHYSTNFGYAVVRPRQSGGPRVAIMERMAYAEGDLAVAAYANRRRALDAVMGGLPIDQMIATVDGCVETARRLGDQPTLITIQALRQFADCLARPVDALPQLSGPHFDIASFEASNLATAVHASRHVYMLEAALAAMFEAWETAAALHDRTRRYFNAPALQLLPQGWYFATALGLYRTGRRPSRWRMAVLRRHARHNPTDHAHRVLLLEAEALRDRGRKAAALVRYEAALHAARASGCAMEHAIVAAAAASGARLLGAEEAASRFTAERNAVWIRLGAVALLRRHGIETPAADGDLQGQADGSGERLRELDAARATAERASRAKSRLLAEVAHELRTPLQGAVALLGGQGEGGDPIDAEALRGTLRHLASVVDDLADMGALEAGGIALASAPFAPRRTVEQVCAMFQGRPGARALVIRGEADAMLLGDEVRVRQVVSNLVSNALKHGRGTVGVEVGLALQDRGAELRIEVHDQGAALSEQDLATIFEPFRRGTSGQAVEGLGLGLPIARRIARAMGGDLRARLQPDGPVFTFQVRLPRAPDASIAGPSKALTVLLAEDVDLSRRVLAKLLTAEGCRVVEARDGLEALARTKTGPVDLVLTDQRMPGLLGSELCRRLRDAGFTRPIAIATGADDPHLRAEVADLADVTVLRKPVDQEMLRAWLAASASGAAGPAADIVHGRVEELVSALGADAVAIFAELQPQLGRLIEELSEAVDGGEPARIAAAAHRVAGLAAHFGLAEIAAQSRSLESTALADPAALPTHAGVALRALRGTAASVDWAPYEL